MARPTSLSVWNKVKNFKTDFLTLFFRTSKKGLCTHSGARIELEREVTYGIGLMPQGRPECDLLQDGEETPM